MSPLAFAGGMITAVAVDIFGVVIPLAGTLFIGFMRLSFWLAGYDMNDTTKITVINGLIESAGLPPTCSIFMALAYKKNQANMKKREKEEQKNAEEEALAAQSNRQRQMANRAQGAQTPKTKAPVKTVTKKI